MIKNNNFSEYLEFASGLADKVGDIMLKSKHTVEIKVKKGELHDFATNVDLTVEKLIIDSIKRKYPSHNILSEEAGEIKGNSPFRWIIDPLDGTWSYSIGLPLFGTIIALDYEGKTVMAVFYLPQTKEKFTGVVGKGVYLNGKKIKVSKTDDVKASFILSNFPSFKTPKDTLTRKLTLTEKLIKETYRFFPSHSSSVDLCRVAQSAFDGDIIIDTSGKWWDLVAGIFFVKEAGGKVTTLDNKDTTYNNYRRGFVASNGKIHDKLLSIVNSVY